jgi:hypothetical protein
LLKYPDLEAEQELNPNMSIEYTIKRQLQLFQQYKYEVKIADLGFSKKLDSRNE